MREPTDPPDHPTTQELAHRFVELRVAAGLDPETFAARVKLDPIIVRELEAGARTWTLDELEAFAKALRVPLSALFTRDASKPA